MNIQMPIAVSAPSPSSTGIDEFDAFPHAWKFYFLPYGEMCSNKEFVTLVNEQGYPIALPSGLVLLQDSTGGRSGICEMTIPLDEQFIEQNYRFVLDVAAFIHQQHQRDSYVLVEPNTHHPLATGTFLDIVVYVLQNHKEIAESSRLRHEAEEARTRAEAGSASTKRAVRLSEILNEGFFDVVLRDKINDGWGVVGLERKNGACFARLAVWNEGEHYGAKGEFRFSTVDVSAMIDTIRPKLEALFQDCYAFTGVDAGTAVRMLDALVQAGKPLSRETSVEMHLLRGGLQGVQQALLWGRPNDFTLFYAAGGDSPQAKHMSPQETLSASEFLRIFGY